MLTKFDNRTTKIVQQDMENTLKEVAERYGLVITQHGGTINSDTEVVLKFRVRVTDEDTVKQKQLRDFNLHCHLFGLEPKHYMTTIILNGKPMQLVGFAMSRVKYPFRFRDPRTGKEMLYTDSVVAKVREAGARASA